MPTLQEVFAESLLLYEACFYLYELQCSRIVAGERWSLLWILYHHDSIGERGGGRRRLLHNVVPEADFAIDTSRHDRRSVRTESDAVDWGRVTAEVLYQRHGVKVPDGNLLRGRTVGRCKLAVIKVTPDD